MSTTAPEITNDTTIGTVVTGATSTPTSVSNIQTSTPSPTSTTRSTLRPTPTSTPLIKEFVQKPLSIYGFGPANSTVTLTGFGVGESTVSDKDGFFEFNKIYSYSIYYPELCISAIDSNFLITYPVCIPGLSELRITPNKVGPIYLPPTVGIKDYVSGYSIPNSEILVFISKKGKYSLPTYSTSTDDQGKYEFVFLKPVENANYEFFVVSKSDENFSGRSNLITFSSMSVGKKIVEDTKNVFFRNKLSVLIVIEVLVIVILAIILLNGSTKRNLK